MIFGTPRHGRRVIAMTHCAAGRHDFVGFDRALSEMAIAAAFKIGYEKIGGLFRRVRSVAIDAFGNVITMRRMIEGAFRQETMRQVYRR